MSATSAFPPRPSKLTNGQKIGIFAGVVIALVVVFFAQNAYERTQLWVVGGSSLASGAVGLVAVLIYKMRKQLDASVRELNMKEMELQVAREVQSELFPKSLPAVPSMDVVAICEPARGISGDYYDFIELPDGRMGIVVADVSGKGVSAAILMANLQALIRSHCPMREELGDVFGRLNAQLFRSTGANRYATMFYGVWCGDTRQLTYVNAGHLAPVLLTRDGVRRLESQSRPLGLFEDTEFHQSTLQLMPGDSLVVFTDGVTDTTNRFGEEFGEARVIELIVRQREQSAGQMLHSILASLARWGDYGDAVDDTTLVIAKVRE